MLNPLLFPHRFLSTWPFSLSLYFFPLSFFLLLFFPFFFLFLFVVPQFTAEKLQAPQHRALDAPADTTFCEIGPLPSSSGSNKIKKPVTVTPVESSRLREACFALPCLDRVVPFRRRKEKEEKRGGTCYRRCNMFS